MNYFQVSHLVVLYEAGQQGQAMPDLVDNIQLVLTCVSNLATVAESTARQSNDATFIVSYIVYLIFVKSLDICYKSISYIDA